MQFERVTNTYTKGEIMPTATPFYLDWGFWQGVAAFSALVISIAPSVMRRIKGSKLEVEAQDIITLTHTIGNPNVYLLLILRNTGGEPIRVKAIHLDFKSKDDPEFRVSARSYFPLSENKPAIFAPFKILPGNDWTHPVYFYKVFSRNEDQKYRLMMSNLRTDLNNKRELNHSPHAQVIGDPVNVEPFIKFFESKFKWNTGEYDVNVVVELSDKLKTITKSFHMTVYESDTAELISYTNDYKTGLGATYDNVDAQPGVAIQLDSK
jgi:hypothetical protein